MRTAQQAIAAYDLSILSRVLKPAHGDLAPEAARSILALDFDAEDRTRMHELAQKAQEDNLSEEEREEAESYERISHFIGMLRSKARVALRAHRSP